VRDGIIADDSEARIEFLRTTGMAGRLSFRSCRVSAGCGINANPQLWPQACAQSVRRQLVRCGRRHRSASQLPIAVRAQRKSPRHHGCAYRVKVAAAWASQCAPASNLFTALIIRLHREIPLTQRGSRPRSGCAYFQTSSFRRSELCRLAALGYRCCGR